jgi:hypothetical protein
MRAKPIIDIDIEIAAREDLEATINEFEGRGTVFVDSGRWAGIK